MQLCSFTLELCLLDSLVVCVHGERMFEGGGQKSAMSPLVWVNLGHGLGGLWIGGLPPLTYPDASFSPQTFIFTDSPDEHLQERLGDCLAGEVVLCWQERLGGHH